MIREARKIKMAKIIIGNLKSYLNSEKILELLSNISVYSNLILAPQTPFLSLIKEKFPDINLSAQDVSGISNQCGAYTGESTALLLKDLGVKYSIIGHSERRQNALDNFDNISTKVKFCLEAGITPILCVGESKEDRDSGKFTEKLSNEVKELLKDLPNSGDVLIAYEPIWSIGTGSIPSNEEIAEVLSLLRESIKSLDNKVFLVYGGSVNVENASILLSIDNLDGLLIGKASTDASKLDAILEKTNLR